MISSVLPAIEGLLTALLSAPCVACGSIGAHPTRGAACEACWASVRFMTPPYCATCGVPITPARPGPDTHAAAAGTGRKCSRCAVERPAVDVARALGPYDGTLRALVHGLKYDGRRSLAPRLAALMRDRCRPVLEASDAVVPVPLHFRREWSRGFNQADAIARGLGLPVWRALRRTRHTAAQTSLAAADRRANVLGAFVVRRSLKRWRRRLRGATVVLVDDVATTGATLEACAVALKDAGVRQVRAVTVARAVLGRDWHGNAPLRGISRVDAMPHTPASSDA